jgi:DNA-binding transcriptional ArsR family regulator
VTDASLSDCLSSEPPEWVTESDKKILTVLGCGLILSPTIIAANIDLHRATVSVRLSSLRASGVVEKVDRGRYRLVVDSGDTEPPCEFLPATALPNDLVEDGDQA